MNKDAMNQGVQILLDRMDTNPEEFDDYAGKWGDIIGAVHARKSIPEGHSKDAPLPFLTDPEVNALYEKLEDVRRENFTADVLRRLADAPKEVIQPELWEKPTYSISNQPVLGTPVTTGTWSASTTGKISLSQADVSTLTIEQKAQLVKALDEYRNQQTKVERKKATTR